MTERTKDLSEMNLMFYRFDETFEKAVVVHRPRQSERRMSRRNEIEKLYNIWHEKFANEARCRSDWGCCLRTWRSLWASDPA